MREGGRETEREREKDGQTETERSEGASHYRVVDIEITTDGAAL